MQQKIIFGLDGLQVNSTQLIANEQTFTLRELTAVKHGYIEPKRGFSTLCVFIGTVLLNFEEVFIIVGGFSIVLGVMAFLTAKTIYTVVIETVHGEHHAFASENMDAVETAIRAINSAIINRRGPNEIQTI
jgi:hypothetical protein